MIMSWIIVVSPVINSTMTIYFIQPYRKFFLHWILFTPPEPSTKANSSFTSPYLKNQVAPFTIESAKF